MKLINLFIVFLITAAFISCYNRDEMNQQKIQDSIRKSDSMEQELKKQHIIDSIETVTREQQVIADSIEKIIREK